eukprot:NODE_2374_length_1078_cov_42.633018_g2356_i0.p1 GENE.NODE_2374_length_1078_cov_42.633018_g2356_i0~~NODE_2374_length_1078_cov_42.633018_g2356_i0.p1  ORF type:complete len:257 (+),score=67.65 NODE_2374_length_1078_cov_42.633018_g2356_i0:253-1023(+)
MMHMLDPTSTKTFASGVKERQRQRALDKKRPVACSMGIGLVQGDPAAVHNSVKASSNFDEYFKSRFVARGRLPPVKAQLQAMVDQHSAERQVANTLVCLSPELSNSTLTQCERIIYQEQQYLSGHFNQSNLQHIAEALCAQLSKLLSSKEEQADFDALLKRPSTVLLKAHAEQLLQPILMQSMLSSTAESTEADTMDSAARPASAGSLAHIEDNSWEANSQSSDVSFNTEAGSSEFDPTDMRATLEICGSEVCTGV